MRWAILIIAVAVGALAGSARGGEAPVVLTAIVGTNDGFNITLDGPDGKHAIKVAGSLSAWEDADAPPPAGVIGVPPTISAVAPVLTDPSTFEVCSTCMAEST